LVEIPTNHLPNKSQNHYRLYKKIRPTDLLFITSAVAVFMMVRLWTTSLTTEESGFDYSFSGSRDFSFATTPRPDLGLIHPPIHWVPRTLSQGIKRPRGQADHSLPLSAEDASTCSYASIYSYVFIAWYLIQQRTIFFYILYVKIPSTLQITVRYT
jgi:hypothetical protein